MFRANDGWRPLTRLEFEMTRDPRASLPLSHVVYHILLALSRESMHGYGIIKDVEERTGGRLVLEAGTLYAAVKRLREEGLLTEDRRPEDTDARRRYYALTDFGRAMLRAESERLAELVEMARMARVLPKTSGFKA